MIQVQAGIDGFSPEMTRALRSRFPEMSIIRAIPVIDEASIDVARSYQGVADFLLLDSYDPDTSQFGALGRIHDWSLSRRIVDDVGIPVILAGGLGPGNVTQAIAAVRPAGVDSKTLTDRADGAGKDLAKVRDFVVAAKLTR
jgi:phosphoribosylanthranilate isomerase